MYVQVCAMLMNSHYLACIYIYHFFFSFFFCDDVVLTVGALRQPDSGVSATVVALAVVLALTLIAVLLLGVILLAVWIISKKQNSTISQS